MSTSDYKDHVFALVVAGGGGTRLWPKSRNKTPKQFLKLFNNKTLIQITADRLNGFLPWKKIYVVTVSEDYKKEIRKQLPSIPVGNIIVEPARKNTAPAHGLGAAYILKQDKDAVIINAAADHLVKPKEKYERASLAAAAAAFGGNYLVALGIKPTYPNIGYGHIKRGVKFGVYNKKTFYKLEKFVEKPPLRLARKYTRSAKYYWNANQYIWRADTYLKALESSEPRVGVAMQRILDSIGEADEELTIEREYKSMPDKTAEGKDLSIDYAVSEKSKNFLVLPVSYGWTDIGDWREVWNNLKQDGKGNVIINESGSPPPVVNIDTSDALIHTNKKLVAILDVDNIIVIDTDDALLVCSKSRAQNVKQLVNLLKKEDKKEYL